MTDDRDLGSDMEDMGPGDVPEPGPEEPELVEDAAGREAEREPGEAPAEGHAEKHGFKETARGTVAKAVGIAVELGSVLGGQGGDIVHAERDVAEAETEDLLDRVDGEG